MHARLFCAFFVGVTFGPLCTSNASKVATGWRLPVKRKLTSLKNEIAEKGPLVLNEILSKRGLGVITVIGLGIAANHFIPDALAWPFANWETTSDTDKLMAIMMRDINPPLNSTEFGGTPAEYGNYLNGWTEARTFHNDWFTKLPSTMFQHFLDVLGQHVNHTPVGQSLDFGAFWKDVEPTVGDTKPYIQDELRSLIDGKDAAWFKGFLSPVPKY